MQPLCEHPDKTDPLLHPKRFDSHPNHIRTRERVSDFMLNAIFQEEPGQCRRTWVWAIPFLVVALFTVGQLLVILPADRLGLVTRETIETYPTVLYLIVGTFAMVAFLFAGWIIYFERRTLSSVGIALSAKSGGFFAKGYGIGLLMGSAVVAAVVLFDGYVFEPGSNEGSRDLLPVLILMFAFILQSSTEELVFRGWMMERLAARNGILAGVIGNSLLFTLMHVEFDGANGSSIGMIIMFNLMTFLFSVFLSLLVLRQRSILGASAWHAAWNWIFISWFGLPTTGIDLKLSPLITDLSPNESSQEWLTGGLSGPEGSIMALVVLCIGCSVLLGAAVLKQGRPSTAK